MAHLVSWPFVVLAGFGVGTSIGLFGVGGSSVATPVLALLGAPGLIAVASPLPATIPAAGVGAVPYLRAGEARPRAAAWSILVQGPTLRRAFGLFLVVFGLFFTAYRIAQS